MTTRRSLFPLLYLALLIAPCATAAQSSTCGNGVLDGDESCDACATDCTIRPCIATEGRFTVQVTFVAPPGRSVSSTTVRLSYRSDVISLPGKGADPTIRERVTGVPSETFSAVNDLGYALRVVASRASDLAAGPLFSAAFDLCQSAAAPTVADLACVVEACGSQTGAVSDCRCTVTTP